MVRKNVAALLSHKRIISEAAQMCGMLMRVLANQVADRTADFSRGETQDLGYPP